MTRPVVVYTLLRLALFVGALGLVSLVGVRGPLALLAALVLSSVASVVLLSRQRDAIGRAAEARRQARQDERDRRRQRLHDEA